MFAVLFVTITSVFYALAAVLFGYAGYSYIVDSYGLHPALAFPLATVFLLFSLAWPVYCHRVGAFEDSEDSEDSEEPEEPAGNAA